MSNKIIGIDEYGSFAKNEKNENVCHKCRYFNYHQHAEPCKSCLEVYYYPNHLEIAKLETELTPETFTINDMYVTSKQLFDCQDEFKESQKELIDFQIENKQLKDRVKELEQTIENNTTELITEREDVFSGCFSEITKTKCCGVAPITNENYCPNCGRRIVR